MSFETQKSAILLYRGTAKARDSERVGAWWSTDPYYALHFSNGERGQLFVAQVDEKELTNHAKDATIDEGYENYLFPDNDPGSVRLATDNEIEALRAEATTNDPTGDMPGGQLLKRPANPIEVGYRIFGPKEVGALALEEAALLGEAEK